MKNFLDDRLLAEYSDKWKDLPWKIYNVSKEVVMIIDSIIKWKIDLTETEKNTLIEEIQKLYDNLDLTKILDIISEMAEYTVVHFKTEEDIFTKLSYSDKLNHTKEHSDFIKQVGDFKDKYKKNKSVLTFEIINFLRKWLNSHILVSDKKYIKEFNTANLVL